ncbi:MAG TPA: 50S ribosomal protein L3 N(5)-glutamine methyltransferase [Denitromonas sp.]|uniref:50S ribosomal protein L3 N(5)-glutamine methyltransferase n=1 Tax=Denitromonas sp. TaxID=2734609 RepID=UPI001D53911C|nr:50S ribosomal protein L3 N(5)-glutamine methyltransferase [Rhodocyclaceae bacterium]MCP5220618.1 50S ribosomal protein L3 N(5)-glutamine methyltransferase [Zoogloeaceae bacterium]HQV13815.1 50S ribosomal protein L3 N(5)-glutamine methyltransferase [Denitromonas sp.]
MSHTHEDHDHDHEDHDHSGPLVELVTLRDWLRYAVTRFNRAQLFFGHGTDNAWDEAVYLMLHTLALPLDRLEPFMDACIPIEERVTLLEVIERRVESRMPAAYLTGEAWLAGYRFRVDPRVIVPRSYFAALLADGLSPWIDDPEALTRVADVCTGSACLAIMMANTFPNAEVDAVDLSADALAVAADNVADYALEAQVHLHQGDALTPLAGQRYDLILSNPPYVTAEAMAALPAEYRHEPEMALAAGDDGLDVVRSLIAQARAHLNPGGLLMVEVGHNRHLVEAAFPDLPLTWLSDDHAEDMIFMLREDELP